MTKSTGKAKKGELNKEEEEEINLQTFTRRFYVDFGSHSLVDLAKTPSLAKWSVPNAEVYMANLDSEQKELIEEQNLLEHAVLVSACIRKVKSTFPCTVAVDITDVAEKKYMLSEGGMADYVAFDMENNPKLDEVVMDVSDTLTSKYLKDHSNYMPHRFSEGIMQPSGQDYSYVPKSHPIITMVDSFSEELQLKLTERDMVDKAFYKVPNNIVEDAKEHLLPQIQSMFPQSNLKEFSVEISRADGLKFDDPAVVLDNVENEQVKFKMMNKKCNLSMVMDITYCFIPKSD